ncbi:hypothetical protein DID76_02970 [Candidatus Marinamargulisbacteria bacterium SCGC AG-414-C22]|nr:hypothetical protein DID76_02970 [Candidatus Marinamargulisbacteria bacterium SCGC AG-414-C22]
MTTENPLDMMNITREHIIALHEAYTHTNKATSAKRAQNLKELLTKLKLEDRKRNSLFWEPGDE